jgi:hypothetical protein
MCGQELFSENDRSCRSAQPPNTLFRARCPLKTEKLSAIAKQMKAGTKVQVEGQNVDVNKTSSQRLKTLSFQLDGREYQAIEQNPEKPSRWGELARKGHHVVQFRDVASGKYVAVAIDGEIKEYGKLGKKGATQS